MKALIIDDDIQIRRLLQMVLESRGHEVLLAETGRIGLQVAAFQRPDVVLLDIGLPDLDGLKVLRALREWSDVPVLMLSVRDEETVKIDALEGGADDYVSKPFSTGELMARLNAIMRRCRVEDNQTYAVGALELDLKQHEATLHGAPVKLTPIEFTLLKLLVQNAGKIVTQRRLLRDIWGPGAEEQGQYLRVHITHLRKKLAGPQIKLSIVNEPGIGYRLVEE